MMSSPTTAAPLTQMPARSTRFWIGFLTVVLPVLFFLWIPKAALGWPEAVAAVVLSPVIGCAMTRCFRSDVALATVLDVSVAVWAALVISAPLVLIIGPAIPVLAFGVAYWAATWKGRHRGPTVLLILVLPALYWAGVSLFRD